MKTRIAAAATVLGLGGLAGIALSAGGQKADPLAAKPLVRTKVIHRTVRVTKHVKPKHPVAAGSAGYASGSSAGEPAPVVTSSSGTGSAEAAPVTTATSGAGGEATPVTTAASGGGAGGEVESEGGGDD